MNAERTQLYQFYLIYTLIGVTIHYETIVTIHLSSLCYGSNCKTVVKNATVIRNIL